MKNLLDKIKNFKYKTITSILILILTQVLYIITENDIFGIISLVSFGYLVFVIYRLMIKGLQNTYNKDKSKTLAIVLSIFLTIFSAGVVYLFVRLWL